MDYTGNTTCRCDMILYSMKLDLLSALYKKEKYQGVPCSGAIAFLRGLDPALHAEKYPMHKVEYTVKDGYHTYTAEVSETPYKAAAKIELFMQDPNLLPK